MDPSASDHKCPGRDPTLTGTHCGEGLRAAGLAAGAPHPDASSQ